RARHEGGLEMRVLRGPGDGGGCCERLDGSGGVDHQRGDDLRAEHGGEERPQPPSGYLNITMTRGCVDWLVEGTSAGRSVRQPDARDEEEKHLAGVSSVVWRDHHRVEHEIADRAEQPQAPRERVRPEQPRGDTHEDDREDGFEPPRARYAVEDLR